MNRRLVVFPLLFAAAIAMGSEPPADSAGTFTFLPATRPFPPLAANWQEPRVGVRKQFGTSHLKLDIGSALDFLEIDPSADRTQSLRVGAEFFTYALTTSSQGLRLQVDAVDGYFGGHIVYLSHQDRSTTALRLRLLHLSAHFLDGHYDLQLGQWKDGRAPIPFTRDFGELTMAWTADLRSAVLRVYSGFAYATLVRPTDIDRFSTLHGVELYSLGIPGRALGKPASIYVADNVTVAGVPAWTATNSLEAGIKFGGWDGSGIRVYLSYYHGREIYSQYYNVLTDQWGLGFSFDVR